MRSDGLPYPRGRARHARGSTGEEGRLEQVVPQATYRPVERDTGAAKILNPKPQHPQLEDPNPQTLRSSTLIPKTLNPKTRILES